MKEFKTLSQQLNILRDRGLNIPTDDKPKKVLREENYYSIINGYKELFLGPNVTANDQSETYIKGSSFYELKSVYVFDRSIRSILLKVILKVEKQFKSIVSYEFSKIHGYNNYLKQSSFDDSKIYGSSKKAIFKYENKIGRINKLIADVQRNISYYYKKKDYIKHYVNSMDMFHCGF